MTNFSRLFRFMRIKVRFIIVIFILLPISYLMISLSRRAVERSYVFLSNQVLSLKSDPYLVSAPIQYSCRVAGDQWIITNTNGLRLETVTKILSLSDWQLLVIGEKRTEDNWIAKLSSSKLLFLDFEDLSKLDFYFVNYIHYGRNAQKNLGYLVAIRCGAKLIFELDGHLAFEIADISIYPGFHSMTDVPHLAFHSKRSPFVNIYGIFGQPQIWPRGIPLNEIQNITEGGWSSLRKNDNETIKGYIHQRVSDHQPDIDAVACLALSPYMKYVSFDRDRYPVAIEKFTFSPYNSKNTIHHQAAFWGLYLPVLVNINIADVWRGFWVQRLLWDIGGHLIFYKSTMKSYRRFRCTGEGLKEAQLLNDEGSKFIRFLNSWNSSTGTLDQRIEELMKDLKNAKLVHGLETEMMRTWISDLKRIGYNLPSISDPIGQGPPIVRVKRAAVCLTGLTECVQEVWASNELKLRKLINGDMDVFLFLSSGMENPKDLIPIMYKLRLRQSRFYNSTVNIVHQDLLDIDLALSSKCKYDYSFTEKRKIVPIEQERYAQASCYDIVRDYERKRNIRYQLMIRARGDSVFTRLPRTLERNGQFNPDKNILIPNENHFYGINDRFAIGPIDAMQHYMRRWYQIPLCLTKNIHPESYLKYILERNNIQWTADDGISLTQVPHGKTQCH